MNNQDKATLTIGVLLIIGLILGWYYFNVFDKRPKYTIELVGNETVTLYQYDTYEEEGFNAYDKTLKDVSNDVDIINYVDTSKVGTYEIIYSIDGVVKKRTVKVIKKEATIPVTTTMPITIMPTTKTIITTIVEPKTTAKVLTTSRKWTMSPTRKTTTTVKQTTTSKKIITNRKTTTTLKTTTTKAPTPIWILPTTKRKPTTRLTTTTKKATTIKTTTTTRKPTTTTKKPTTIKTTTTTKKTTTTTKKPTTIKTTTTTKKPTTTTKAPIISAECKAGIKTTNLKGMHGVAMRSWGVYPKEDAGSYTRSISAGETFEILGENDPKNHWAIIYKNECGWVNSNYMAINLKDYIPTITYNITNASASWFKSSEKNIADLTGKKLYTNMFNDFVPARYSFAKKLKNAQNAALAKGDSIVIYDAYRPYKVSQYANTKLTALYNSDSVVKRNIDVGTDSAGNTYSWGKAWFLAQGYSAHNYACAVDASLKVKNGSEYSMPSAMHELSTKAVKYKNPSASNNSSAYYSDGMKNSPGAQKLSDYMMNGGGLNDLASEWWHYQDTSCMSGAIGDFWSNV